MRFFLSHPLRADCWPRLNQAVFHHLKLSWSCRALMTTLRTSDVAQVARAEAAWARWGSGLGAAWQVRQRRFTLTCPNVPNSRTRPFRPQALSSDQTESTRPGLQGSVPLAFQLPLFPVPKTSTIHAGLCKCSPGLTTQRSHHSLGGATAHSF